LRARALSAAHRVVRSRSAAPAPEPNWWDSIDDDEAFVREAYQVALGREGDPAGVALHVAKLAEGWTRADVVGALSDSQEAADGPIPRMALEAFHGSRVTWIRSLPPARRILDLGGTCLGDDRGALVAMGYPYQFEDLVIIELPADDRHELYRLPENSAVQTERGPVRYLYRSMTDLADLADGSFDMICSAQTFEHIYPDEGAKLLHDVRRLLAPDGVLALDTPNGAMTSIQAREQGEEFINPDHKVEYTHQQMLALFADAGLRVVREHGIGYLPATAASGTFELTDLVENPGLYADIERSYTLAYLATPA
jgi:SAM-dependent methyltransferase